MVLGSRATAQIAPDRRSAKRSFQTGRAGKWAKTENMLTNAKNGYHRL